METKDTYPSLPFALDEIGAQWEDRWSSPKNKLLSNPSIIQMSDEYQNQRVSLTIKFQALSDSWQISFAIVISLIDDRDERVIHSSEQISYMSMKDCTTKFNLYLLY